MVKIIGALRPITVSGLVPLAQYLLMPFGEFLLGILGLQTLVAMAPRRLKFSVHVDWFLILGFANLTILLVTQLGLPVLYKQVNTLSLVVLVSFMFMLLMALRY